MPTAAAAAPSPSNSITPRGNPLQPAVKPIELYSFTGIYHLNRDRRGLSILTTEETIVAGFPDGGYYGINRVLPKTYQNHSVDIKVLTVSDAGGNPVRYTTKDDDKQNLVITTGDPSIILFGSQTIKIRYETKGVIDLSQQADELLLNVNGRGWDQPLPRADATVFIPQSVASLTDKPGCYTAVGTQSVTNCTVSQTTKSGDTVIQSRATNLLAHQALVVKLKFAPATFSNNRDGTRTTLIIIGGVALAIGVIAATIYRRTEHAQPE